MRLALSIRNCVHVKRKIPWNVSKKYCFQYVLKFARRRYESVYLPVSLIPSSYPCLVSSLETINQVTRDKGVSRVERVKNWTRRRWSVSAIENMETPSTAKFPMWSIAFHTKIHVEHKYFFENFINNTFSNNFIQLC